MKLDDIISPLLFITTIPVAYLISIATAVVPLVGAIVALYFTYKKYKRDDYYHAQLAKNNALILELKTKLIEQLDNTENLTEEQIDKIIEKINNLNELNISK